MSDARATKHFHNAMIKVRNHLRFYEHRVGLYTGKLEKLKELDAAYPYKFFQGDLPDVEGWKEWAKENLGYGKNKRYIFKEQLICFSDQNDAFAFRMRWT